MPQVRLSLSEASQKLGCSESGVERGIYYSAKNFSDEVFVITYGDSTSDARSITWRVSVFSLEETPISDFYVQLKTQRNMKVLAAAVLLDIPETGEKGNLRISVYVWLPEVAFNSLWNIVWWSSNFGHINRWLICRLTLESVG
jgi:hypothetical protein